MIKTIFCDIDGTLLKHHGDQCLYNIMKKPPELLPNVIETIGCWKDNEYKIILTTGRPERMRNLTQEQLDTVGIFYDMLIMGLPHGERIVINDSKPSLSSTAIGVVVERNKGFSQEHKEL